jgi:DNA mismatch endonuclease (patch repair protein)
MGFPDGVIAMTDRFGSNVRSRIVSSIHGKDTRPELAVRSALHGMGFRF